MPRPRAAQGNFILSKSPREDANAPLDEHGPLAPRIVGSDLSMFGLDMASAVQCSAVTLFALRRTKTIGRPSPSRKYSMISPALARWSIVLEKQRERG